MARSKFELTKVHDDWFTLEPWIIGCPEGKKDQWLAVIACIQKGKSCHLKRVEAKPAANGEIRWSSPRNSNDSAVIMPKVQVKDFIKQALKVLNDATQEV